ncbi:hypothetical protein [Streptomyces murinus]|uniref:hypothetical protein n=1 Tax=Streptomyces murinus TaxID=33900 RepID=UPI00380C117F
MRPDVRGPVCRDGIPTLLLALLAGLAHRRMDVTTFRALVFQALCQIAFAAYLMPAPLVPENWTAKPSLEFVEKLLGET